MGEPAARVYIAFRFHGNFYHSYRGDTPDELGFGKDIRIIRHIIDTLEEFNKRGIDVRGTWDYENYFSLEKIMPEHCPDIVESIQRRVAEGRDEIQFMSYNNGMISAHTAREFQDAVGKAVTNEDGSGVRDLFGTFGPMVRPQEMMLTPMHLRLYPRYGITAVSLFYSALPFNSFSNFIPPLSFVERYNPLTLTYPGVEGSMTLVPAYNTGDLADNITLRRWAKRLRREQLALDEPKDVLLLIDMDADDDFWVGLDIPVVDRVYSLARGLTGLVEDVADLDYVVFTTPSAYLETHEPVGYVSFGQDTADGSFDGYSSWAEKWSNQVLWTGIDRSRILEYQTRRLLVMGGAKEAASAVEEHLSRSHTYRVRSLSTTHFGLSSPVMNVTRLGTARDIIAASVESAREAFTAAEEGIGDDKTITIIDYERGISTDDVHYGVKSSRCLVNIELAESTGKEVTGIVDDRGAPAPAAICPPSIIGDGRGRRLFTVIETDPGGEKRFSLATDEKGDTPNVSDPVMVDGRTMKNEHLSVSFDGRGNLAGCTCRGVEAARGMFLTSGLTYNDRRSDVSSWETIESAVFGGGLVGIKRQAAELPFRGGAVRYEREILIASGLPYLYITVRVCYPKTPDKKYLKGRAERLQQVWDGRWEEVMPCEIAPNLTGEGGRSLRIWKHNYLGHVSSYDLNYGDFSSNKELDSSNNHITCGWVAVTDQRTGLLVAQTTDALTSQAFCPVRTRVEGEDTVIYLNPFGSYYGKQLKYDTGHTGLGRILGIAMSDHLDPYAPSYNGKVQEFTVMIAPYAGDEPPVELQNDALAFAYPPLVIGGGKKIIEPPCRRWEGFK